MVYYGLCENDEWSALLLNRTKAITISGKIFANYSSSPNGF